MDRLLEVSKDIEGDGLLKVSELLRGGHWHTKFWSSIAFSGFSWAYDILPKCVAHFEVFGRNQVDWLFQWSFPLRGFMRALRIWRDEHWLIKVWKSKKHSGFNPLGKILDFTGVRDIRCFYLMKWLIKLNLRLKMTTDLFEFWHQMNLWELFDRHFSATGSQRLRN